MSANVSTRRIAVTRRATFAAVVWGAMFSAVEDARAQGEEKPALPAAKSEEKRPAADEPLQAPEPPPVTNASPAPLPPLPPPRADEQEPRPYTRAADPKRPMRGVDIGPDIGVAVRPSNRGSVSYGAAFAIGGHALIELTRWLGFRALFLTSDHAVTIDRGQFGIPNSDVHQPDLELALIAGRVEPAWVVSRRVKLWAGAGAGLAYFVAPVATSTGELQIQTARRSGVAVDIGGALGGTFEMIPDWFTVALSGSAAFTTGHTGDAFHAVQSFDAIGRRYYADSLPEFAGSFAAIASLGLLL